MRLIATLIVPLTLTLISCAKDTHSDLSSFPIDNDTQITDHDYNTFVKFCSEGVHQYDSNFREYCKIAALYLVPDKSLTRRIYTYDTSRSRNVCLTNKTSEGGGISWDNCVYNSLEEDISKAEMQKWVIKTSLSTSSQELFIYNIHPDRNFATFLSYKNIDGDPELELSGTTVHISQLEEARRSATGVNFFDSYKNITFNSSVWEFEASGSLIYFLKQSPTPACLSKYYDRNEIVEYGNDSTYLLNPFTGIPTARFTVYQGEIIKKCLPLQFANFYVGK